MRIVFNNGEKEFPIIRAGENYDNSINEAIKQTLQLTLYNNNDIFNDFLNYINSNKEQIIKIEIYNNLDQKIYSTTELVFCNSIYRSMEENNNFISVNFIKKQ